jgi:hypothetical protein
MNKKKDVNKNDVEYCTCKFCILEQMVILLEMWPLGKSLGRRKSIFYYLA